MKEFDPYNFDYKTYIEELYSISEMPEILPKITYSLDDYIRNNYEGIRIEKTYDFVKLFHGSYRVFFKKEDEVSTHALLDKNTPYVCAYHDFKFIKTPIEGLENIEVWNGKYNKGLIRLWFKDEVIPKTPTIISDKIQSDKGFNFWVSLLDNYVLSENTHEMFIMDYNNGKLIKPVFSEIDMKNFRGEHMHKFRFVLKKK